MKRQIFLGGSCDPTTWRRDTAEAKAESELLLFVIDGQTRAIASILEATEQICTGRDVLLVVEPIPEGTEIDGQPIAGRQLKDLNRARSFLLDLMGRYPNVEAFPSVESSIQSAADRLREAELVTA
jgi:hypothetical protein